MAILVRSLELSVTLSSVSKGDDEEFNLPQSVKYVTNHEARFFALEDFQGLFF